MRNTSRQDIDDGAGVASSIPHDLSAAQSGNGGQTPLRLCWWGKLGEEKLKSESEGMFRVGKMLFSLMEFSHLFSSANNMPTLTSYPLVSTSHAPPERIVGKKSIKSHLDSLFGVGMTQFASTDNVFTYHHVLMLILQIHHQCNHYRY